MYVQQVYVRAMQTILCLVKQLCTVHIYKQTTPPCLFSSEQNFLISFSRSFCMRDKKKKYSQSTYRYLVRHAYCQAVIASLLVRCKNKQCTQLLGTSTFSIVDIYSVYCTNTKVHETMYIWCFCIPTYSTHTYNRYILFCTYSTIVQVLSYYFQVFTDTTPFVQKKIGLYVSTNTSTFVGMCFSYS